MRHLLWIVILGLWLGLCGCEGMERVVAKAHGIKVDPLPGPCAPDSLQAGRCVPTTEGAAR
jgi:hypothetical protein